MGQVFEKFYAATTESKIQIPRLTDTLITLNNVMVTWGNVSGGEIVDCHLSSFFKFVHHETRDL